MLISSTFFNDLNSTFSTPREDSLLKWSIGGARYTHRLSKRERELRIAFVQKKLASRLMTELGIQIINQNTVNLERSLPISYSRNRITVDSKVLAMGLWGMKSDFAAFYKMFDGYWRDLTALKQFKILIGVLRRHFGSDVIHDGILRPTRSFHLDCLAFFTFKKPFFDLNKNQKKKIIYKHADEAVSFLLNHHPFGTQIKELISNIMNAKRMLRSSNFLLSMNEGDLETILVPLIRSLPSFDAHLLGYKRLTVAQLARLQSRKVFESSLMLFNLLYEKSFHEDTISLSSDTRFVLRLTASGYYVYRPHVKLLFPDNHEPYDSGEHINFTRIGELPREFGPLTYDEYLASRPHIKFVTPSFIASKSGVPIMTYGKDGKISSFIEALTLLHFKYSNHASIKYIGLRSLFKLGSWKPPVTKELLSVEHISKHLWSRFKERD